MRSVAHRFDVLDGFRGVAAISVLLAHLVGRAGAPIFMSAYLAVDLFFLLSGFVIAHAYEQKLRDGLSPATFVSLRLQRLYPLVVLGAVIGASVHVADFDGSTFGLLFVRALLLIPTRLEEAGPTVWLITFNFVGWSLRYELIANLLYGLIARHLSNLTLAVLLLVFGGLLLMKGIDYGSLDFGSRCQEGDDGLYRALFSFFLGIALLRAWQRGLLDRIRAHPIVVAVALVAVMATPHTGPGGGYIDLVAVFLLFPIAIAAGAHARMEGMGARICAWLGIMSYPIYIVQSGPSDLVRKIAATHGFGSATSIALGLALVPLTVLIAYGALKWVDEPAQDWFRARRKAAASRGIAPAL